MAFKTAAGYGNLPNGNFSPVIYSKQVQLAFRKSSIVEAIQTLITLERFQEWVIPLRLLKNLKLL